MLQSFGGAVEQSYFVVATQFSAVSLIATSSVLRIIWKEVSEANHNNDHVKIITLYQKSTHMLFFVGVIISGFLIPWVVEIIAVTLDSRYLGGALVMAVMLVYPIHQSLGQLNGTILNALELSKEKMILETGQIILSIIVSYIVLAPSDAAIPGLGLASYGLAVKMVCMQIVYVNFVIWWLSRRLGFEFNIYYQVKGLVVFPLLGVGAYNIGNLSDELVLSFIVAAVVYMMMFFVIVYFYPNVVGLDKKDFHGLVAKLRKW